MDSLPTPGPSARELELLRRMARIANIGGWEYDPLARELYWTEQVFRIVEVEPYSVAPTLESTVGFYAPEARATIARALQSALEHGEAWDLELPLITARGRRIWVRVIGEPEVVDGRCIKLAGTLEDVTAARRAREALKARSAENRRLALVAENTSNLVLITGPDDRIQWTNASFTRVTGYARAEAVGHTPCDLLCRGDAAADPRLAAVREQMQRGEPVRGLLVELTRKDGSRYWAEVEIRPVLDERGAVANYIHIQNDVTDSRRAAAQMQEAIERLHVVKQTMAFGTLLRDPTSGEARWDGQALRLHGYPETAPAPSTEELLARIHPDDRARFRAAWEGLLQARGVQDDEYRVVHPDGRIAYIHARTFVERAADGVPLRVIGIVFDVTDKRVAEEQALAATESLELAISATGIGFFYRDLDQPEPVWDAQMYRIHGLAPDEPMPRADERHAMVLPEDRPAFLAAREAMHEREAPMEIEYRIRRRDGAVRWIRSRRAVVRVGPQHVPRIVGALLDVTEVKEAEEKQRLLTERLALASRTAGIGIWEIDLDTQQVVWNDQMFRIYGLPPDETPPAMTDWVQHWVHDSDRERVAAKAVEFMRRGGSYQDEHRVVLRDGAERWIDARAFLYRPDPDRPGRVIGVNFDITERKLAEARSADYAEELRAALARLELATSGSDVGIFERALDKRPGFWSAQMFRLYGEPPQQAAPDWDWLLARIEPEDHALFESQWERIKQSPAYVDTEFRIRRPDGSRAWLMTRARLEPADGQRPARVVGIGIDITQRKEAESRAAQYADWLRLTTSTIGIALWQRELDSGRTVWDAQCMRMFGLAEDAPVPTLAEYLAFVLPEDRARVAQATTDVPPAGQPLEIEYRIRRTDGAVRTILSRRAVQCGADGRPLRVLGAAIDVTESREAEARLRDAQQRLRLAAEAGGIASWERNLETGEARWDEAMFDFYGLPRAPVAPALDVVLSLVHPEDRAAFADAWKRMANSTDAVEWECRIVRRDGSVVHLASRGRADRRADGTAWRVIGVALDVTASRRTAQQLRDALARLRLSTEIGAIGTWERDADGAGRWDPVMFRLFGLPPGEAPTREQAVALAHPEDRPGVLAAWQRMLQADDAVEFEYRVVRPDGTVVDLNTRGRAERGADGRVLRIVGATIDVTASRTAQRRLKEINERLQLAAAATGIGFWLQGLDGASLDADRQMMLMYGFDPDGPVASAERFFAAVLPEDRPALLAERARARTSDEPIEFEYRIMHPLKGVRHILSRCALRRDAAGQPLHVVGASLDVTETRRAEAALRSANERLELATRTAGIGVWEWTPRADRVTWDARMHELYGQPSDWAPTRSAWLACIHPDDRERVARRFGSEHAPAEGGECEYRIVRPDGEERVIAERFVSRCDAEGRAAYLLGTNIDVTEIRRTQRERDELSDRLRLATASVGMGVWVWDLATRTSVWDDAMYALFGATRESFADRIWLDAVHPDDRDRAARAVQDAWDGVAPLDIEFRVLWPDGSVRHLASRGSVERDASGVAVRMVGVNWDVTESHAAKQRALELAERLKLATAAAGLAAWHIDTRTRKMDADELLCRMHGVPPGPHRDLWPVLESTIHPEDLPALKQASIEARLEGKPFEAEYRTLHPDGSIRHLAVRGVYQRDDAGEPVRMYGVTFDVSARVQAERALRAAEQTARALLERMRMTTSAVGIGLWEVDLASGAVAWDDQMCKLYGRTRTELGDLAQQWRRFVHPDDRERVQRASLRALETGQPLDFEARIVLPDGAVRHLAHRAQTERDAQGRRVRQLGVAWDVTERRTAEAALLAKETAERASQAKSEFLSRMSHELRTPLNAIIGFTQVLDLDRTHPLAPAQRDRVDKIQQAGWHLLNLINEILDLSRIEAGALQLSMAIVPLGEVVDECIALVAADAQRRALSIGQTQTARAPANVWADRTRLKQVLLNLLSNAVKYNREGGRIDIDLDADAEGRALISVRDTGPGLAPAQIKKLFEPFNRLGREAGPIEGTGIGLTIALRLVEQMGGALTVTSEPGAGSAFHVALQAASAARDEAADVLQAIAPASVEPRDDVRGTVLYVEDNASNVAVVEQLLALRPNVKLFTAGDGASGRVMAAVCQPDLILLDMRLPDTDGASLLAELRARPEAKSIPCIGVSANAMPADIAHARAAGFADYWTKPIEAGPFLRGIDAALARPR